MTNQFYFSPTEKIGYRHNPTATFSPRSDDPYSTGQARDHAKAMSAFYGVPFKVRSAGNDDPKDFFIASI
jgi:hypothetical protein